MSDQDIQKLENQFLMVSGSAFVEARKEALAHGLSVLQSENGVIYEVFPNGYRKELKRVEPPSAVVLGSVITIR